MSCTLIFNIIVLLPRDKYDYVFKTNPDFTLFSVNYLYSVHVSVDVASNTDVLFLICQWL